jgi:hypothetical protein
MGGRVAFQFVQTHLSQSIVDPIDHVITLDAPVNGVNIYSPPFILFADSFFETDAVLEMHAVGEAHEALEYLNKQSAFSLAQKGTVVRTMTNAQDVLVRPSDAFVEGYGKAFHLYNDVDGNLSAKLGHNQILDWDRFPEVGDYMYSTLSSITQSPGAS